jgi:hypothetical protein
MPERLGCNEEEAIRHLGCSQNKFDELKSRRIVIPLCKGWYSYRLLDEAMRELEAEAKHRYDAVVDRKPKSTKASTFKPKTTAELINLHVNGSKRHAQAS